MIGQRMGNYFRAIGGLPVKTPVFDTYIPKTKVKKYEFFGLYDYEPRVPYLNRNGMIEYLKFNSRRELKELMKYSGSKLFTTDFLDCYEVGDIYTTVSNGVEVAREKIVSFDALYLYEKYRETKAAETIAYSLSSVHKVIK
jgi:hypothetical protein